MFSGLFSGLWHEISVACQIVFGAAMKVLQPWLRANNFDHDGTHVLHVCSLTSDWQVGESLRKLEGEFSAGESRHVFYPKEDLIAILSMIR